MTEQCAEGDYRLTDAEWREFQSIPDQGYSHRAWVEARIRERAERAWDEGRRDAETEVTRWRRRALFAEEAIRRAMRLYHAAVREGLTLQPTAVRDALAPQTIEPSEIGTPPGQSGTEGDAR